ARQARGSPRIRVVQARRSSDSGSSARARTGRDRASAGGCGAEVRAGAQPPSASTCCAFARAARAIGSAGDSRPANELPASADALAAEARLRDPARLLVFALAQRDDGFEGKCASPGL